MLGSLIGLSDLKIMFIGLCMVVHWIYSKIIASRPDVTVAVQNGKYIPKEVTTDTDTQGGVPQRPVEALEQGSNEPQATVPQQQTAPQWQSSNQSKVPERASSPKKQLAVITSAQTASKTEKDMVLPTEPDNVEGPIDGQASVENDDVLQIKPEAIEEPTGGDICVVAETGNDFEIEGEVVNTATNVQTSVGAKFDETIRNEPKTIMAPANSQTSRRVKAKKARRTKSRTIKAPTHGHASHDPEAQAKPRIVRTREEVAKAHCYFGVSDEQKNSDAFQLGSRIVESPTGRKLSPEEEEDEEDEKALQVFEGPLNRLLNRFSTADDHPCTVFKEDGASACGVTVRRLMKFKLGRFRSQISKRTHANKVRTLRRKLIKGKSKGNGSLTGTEGIGAGESMEVDEEMIDPEDEDVEVDEVMIGSDVEAEMDVSDDGVPNSDGDSVGEPMRLEEDNPQVQANGTSNQSQHGTINMQNLQDRLQRERAQIALRQVSGQQVSSGQMASSSISAMAQSSQQNATPVSLSQTMGISMPQGIAQTMTSTNSAADLREARLGKKAEPKTAPEEAKSSVPSTGVAVTEARVPRVTLSILPPASTPLSTSPQEGMKTEGGNTSESDQSATTPASTTPPSTTSSTPPKSPLSENVAATGGSSAPGSATGVIDAPKKEDRKRSCTSLGRSRDDEASGDASKKEKANQSAQSMPGSGPPNVSATRKILLSKPTKRVRQVQKDEPKVSKAKDDQNEPTSETSPFPQPDAAESSKKARNAPKRDAKSEEDITPLSEIPDKALTGKSTSWIQLHSPARHQIVSFLDPLKPFFLHDHPLWKKEC